MARPPDRPSSPSDILTALLVATTAKAKMIVVQNTPILKSPINGTKISVQPSLDEKNQPSASPTTEIKKNLTGPRSPAAVDGGFYPVRQGQGAMLQTRLM